MPAPSTNNRPIIDWQTIDLVLLDMDGTLLDLRFDNVFWLEYLPRHYARENELEEHVAREQLMSLFSEHDGRLQWYCVDYWSERLQLDVAALKPQLAELIAWHPGAEAFLDWLAACGKQRWLATNAHRASLDLKDARVGLAGRLERMISAHDIGHPKESQGFWASLAAMDGVDLSRALLVDDNLAALASAHEAGVGATVAISRPDSGGELRAVSDFPAVEYLVDLIEN